MSNVQSITSNFRFWSWYWDKKSKELSIVFEKAWTPMTQFEIIWGARYHDIFLRESFIFAKKLAIYSIEDPEDIDVSTLTDLGYVINVYDSEMPDTSGWELLSPEIGVKVDWQISMEQIGRLLQFAPYGKYPSGSQGNLEGAFIYCAMKYAIDSIGPDAVIVDLTKLDYDWGDGLSLSPHPFCYLDSLIAFVCKPAQVQAFTGEGISPERVFNSFENAISFLQAIKHKFSSSK